MATFDTHEAVRRLTASGMDEAPAEAVVGVVRDATRSLVTKADLTAMRDLVTKRDLAVAVAELTAEMHRALRVQGMWIVVTLVAIATLAALMATTALMVLGIG